MCVWGGAIIGTIYHSNTIFNLTIPYKESIPAIKSFYGIDAIAEDYPIWVQAIVVIITIFSLTVLDGRKGFFTDQID